MKFVEGHTVGVDLGTTYSAIAQLDSDGQPISLKNTDGRSITPSVVLLGEEGRVVVGPSFERTAIEDDPSRIIEAVKRHMGDDNFYVVYQEKKLTAEFLSALILKKMKQDAEKEIGPIANAVITVPYYFNDVRRKATQDAGRIAGLNVIDIINEPTAATLAYAWKRDELGNPDAMPDGDRTILVYDLGGGTFDVTIVRYSPTQFRVLATDGDVMLGGLDLESADRGSCGRTVYEEIRQRSPPGSCHAANLRAGVRRRQTRIEPQSSNPGFHLPQRQYFDGGIDPW